MSAKHKLTQEQRAVLARATKALGLSADHVVADRLAEAALELLVLERRHIAARMHNTAGLADLQQDLARGRS